MSKDPLIKVRDSGLSTAIFCENVENRKTGEVYPRYTFAIQRSYVDKNGDYVNQTINAYSDEALMLANVITNAYNKLLDYKMKDRENRQANEENKAKAKAKAPAATTKPQDFDDDIPF